MKEIELKAHVYNKAEVISKLNQTATYLGKLHKNDNYFHIPTTNNEKKYISVRIRKEESFLNGETTQKTYFTYKRKELLQGKDNVFIEVNDENECLVDDDKALAVFFSDLGGTLSLKKEKIIEHWNMQKDCFTIHIELCNVPPLGDFLEIEVVTDQDDEPTVLKIKKLEEEILNNCNIPIDNIEKRYYSDMLNKD